MRSHRSGARPRLLQPVSTMSRLRPTRSPALSSLLAAGLALAAGATPARAQAHGVPSPAAAEPRTRTARSGARHPDHPADSAFAAVQARGADRRAMGVDQYTSVHRFDALPDGGRIELQREVDDSAGVARIRTHLRAIAAAFAEGDFRTPAFVHMREVPGTAVMAARRAVITYSVGDLPRGGEVRIVTRDPEALAAVHAFIAFQRQDHRAGGAGTPGHEHHHPPQR